MVTLRIFLASPGDVVEERGLARDAIAELQREPQFEAAKLVPVSWDDTRALALAEAALGSDDPEVAVYLNKLGNVLQDHGDLPAARAAYERVLGPDHPNTRKARANLESLDGLPGARRLAAGTGGI